MTRFIIGLLLGLLLGIGGTAAFLITAGGGDYFVTASPRVRELENSLKNADQDREWLRRRLTEASDAMARLESRFVALSARFEAIVEGIGGSAAAGRSAPSDAAPATASPGDDAAGQGRGPGEGTAAGAPAARTAGAPATPTPAPSERPET